MSTSTSWALDIGRGSQICIDMQGLRMSRALTNGEVMY